MSMALHCFSGFGIGFEGLIIPVGVLYSVIASKTTKYRKVNLARFGVSGMRGGPQSVF